MNKGHHFSCGIQATILSGQDSPILPTQVADHSVGFGPSYQLGKIWITKGKLLQKLIKLTYKQVYTFCVFWSVCYFLIHDISKDNPSH